MLSTTTCFSYLVLGLAACASFVGANPAPSLTTKDIDLGLSARSDGIAYHRRDFYPEPRTNAERLKRGLSPLPPKRRHNGSRLQARQSAVPPPTCTATGYISVSYTNGVVYSGYLGKINSNGEFTLVSSTATALHVSISGCSPEGPVEITILNPSTSHTFLGGTEGIASDSASLLPGTANYMFLVEASHSPLGAPSSVGTSLVSGNGAIVSETVIWNIGADGAITATWVNTDGSPAVSTTIVFVRSAGEFVLVGDVATFTQEYPGYIATFTFVADA